MKTLFLALLCFFSGNALTAQVTCILCYDQNDAISSGVTNLLQNGSFESGCITGSFCPASADYACDIPSWVCTGGGVSTYAQVFDPTGAYYGIYLSEIHHGLQAVYLGNYFATACPGGPNNLSCLNYVDCTVMSLPAGYPTNTADYGGSVGLSISQDVTGLNVGSTYVLEFWAGGEYDSGLEGDGVFAVNVGFGDTLLTCKATGVGQVGTTYIIQFKATSATHTITFKNWGHIADDHTEVVLDNVRLYTLAELSPTISPCAASTGSSDFNITDSTVCEQACVDFFDASTNNPTSWSWMFPGGTPAFSNDQHPTSICYNASGTYAATLITTGDSGVDTVTLNNVVTVYAAPAQPTITSVGNTLSTDPASSYQWQYNSTDIPGATNQTYVATQSGSYTVIVSNGNNCSNAASIKFAFVGIETLIDEAKVFLYPSPSDGTFHVEINGLSTLAAVRDVSVVVTNPIGQVVHRSSGNIVNGTFKQSIALPDVCDGLYVVELASNGDHGENHFVLARRKVLITTR